MDLILCHLRQGTFWFWGRSGLGFRVEGLRFSVESLGRRAAGLGFKVGELEPCWGCQNSLLHRASTPGCCPKFRSASSLVGAETRVLSTYMGYTYPKRNSSSYDGNPTLYYNGIRYLTEPLRES